MSAWDTLSERAAALRKRHLRELFAADSDRASMAKELKMGDANNVRVNLHRARRKLAKLTGLDKS